jgi:hypothetical protein
MVWPGCQTGPFTTFAAERTIRGDAVRTRCSSSVVLDPTPQPFPTKAVLGHGFAGPMICRSQPGRPPQATRPTGTRVGQGTGYPTAFAVATHIPISLGEAAMNRSCGPATPCATALPGNASMKTSANGVSTARTSTAYAFASGVIPHRLSPCDRRAFREYAPDPQSVRGLFLHALWVASPCVPLRV